MFLLVKMGLKKITQAFSATSSPSFFRPGSSLIHHISHVILLVKYMIKLTLNLTVICIIALPDFEVARLTSEFNSWNFSQYTIRAETTTIPGSRPLTSIGDDLRPGRFSIDWGPYQFLSSKLYLLSHREYKIECSSVYIYSDQNIEFFDILWLYKQEICI